MSSMTSLVMMKVILSGLEQGALSRKRFHKSRDFRLQFGKGPFDLGISSIFWQMSTTLMSTTLFLTAFYLFINVLLFLYNFYEFIYLIGKKGEAKAKYHVKKIPGRGTYK